MKNDIMEKIKPISRDSRTRKWFLTINNPIDKGYTHDKIKSILGLFDGLSYWCMCDEIGLETKTYHTHLYIYCNGAVRFTTITGRFEGVDCEMAKGSSQQVRDYIRKEGKYEKDKKKETNLIDTFEEFGQLPLDRPGYRSDIADLYSMVKDGLNNYEIIDNEPCLSVHLALMNNIRQEIKYGEWSCRRRLDLEVTYIYGESKIGKTRFVRDKFGDKNVYVINNYRNLNSIFDNYSYQDVLVFDEFRGQIPIVEMLSYLDIYPLPLPARYNNKWACFTKVYIISNISLKQQYLTTQDEHYKDEWIPFINRIHYVSEFKRGDMSHSIITREEYFKQKKIGVNDLLPIEDLENLPF